MELKALKFSKRRVLILFIDKIKLYKFYGRSLSIVVCALLTLIFTPLRLPASSPIGGYFLYLLTKSSYSLSIVVYAFALIFTP